MTKITGANPSVIEPLPTSVDSNAVLQGEVTDLSLAAAFVPSAPASHSEGVAAKKGIDLGTAQFQLASATVGSGRGTANTSVLPFNPYEGISAPRQQTLNNRAQGLLEKYSRDGSLSFYDFGKMLNDIAAMRDLNTQEKANLWTTIAGSKDKYTIINDGLKPDNIDSFRPNTSAGHVVIGFNDGYHAPLAMRSLDDAIYGKDGIIEHEQTEGGLVGGVIRGVVGAINGNGSLNTGDATASINQVRSLQAFRNGGFAGYAAEWNRRFIGN